MTEKLKLNWTQRLLINGGGHIPVGRKKRQGWKGPLMFYAFKCKKHGVVTNYVSGGRTLKCPKCMYETKIPHLLEEP